MASSSRSRSSALFFFAAAAAALAAVRAQQPSAIDQAVAALYPDPSPSERGAGNQLYTTLTSNQTNSSISALIKSNPTASAVKASLSDASHAISNTITTLEDPKGNFTLAKFHAIDEAEFRVWNASSKTCNSNTALPKPPLSFAFQGSGLLLPFYFGVVEGLQQKGVLTPQVQSTASFGGLSGGSFTSILTALGWKGSDMWALFQVLIFNIAQCKANYPTDPVEASLKCTLNIVGIPIIKAKLLATSTEQEILKTLSNRVHVWTCQVDPRAKTIANSVGQAIDSFASLDEVLGAVRVSDMIPCFSDDAFYNTFRGSAYIDGGYCNDYAQLCPGGLTGATTKCLKISTAFLGPNLPPGTQPATNFNCPLGVVADNKWVNQAKGYFTPANESSWSLANGNCRNPADKEAAGLITTRFVPQGVTAKPDIHPAFYEQFSVFPDACAWQSSATAPQYGLQGFAAMYSHGIASAKGWALQNGYC